jgi:hypothetical protein
MDLALVFFIGLSFMLIIISTLLWISYKHVDKPNIIKSIEREVAKMESNPDWDWIYVFLDLHGTVIKPNFVQGNTDVNYYPLALETLRLMSQTDELRLIIYTSSHPDEIEGYAKQFEADGVKIWYVNENPEVPNHGYGFYDKKPYFNILFEDKAGFFGETDWGPVHEYFKKRYVKNKG